MVRINLLPTKKAARLDSLRNELFMMIGVIIATIIGLFVWDQSLATELEGINIRMSQLNADIDRLSKEVKEIDKLKGKQKKIEAKLKAITKLEAKRYGPAIMLDELASIVTTDSKRVWLTYLRQEGKKLVLKGKAMDHEDVSEFQTSLERRQIFKAVVLKKVSSKKDGDIDILEWEISCKIHYSKGA